MVNFTCLLHLTCSTTHGLSGLLKCCSSRQRDYLQHRYVDKLSFSSSKVFRDACDARRRSWLSEDARLRHHTPSALQLPLHAFLLPLPLHSPQTLRAELRVVSQRSLSLLR
ncbi:hypothetical protein M011DRAFT_20508 [Sporormia fimetaria CBS 119925]|uniref:Secreted protein n=1 Tax=Sporormia fimetaria CBS 119925 TaxID=1340428 RepID=A0A6A6VNT6_9PLEO|nr:hypothetical protein M011DRAFT_20508 [Sporormia fimetaria CBS 119925]